MRRRFIRTPLCRTGFFSKTPCLLLGTPLVQRAPYIGRYGWINVSVRDQDSLELALELVDETCDRIVASEKRRKVASGSSSRKRPRG
jgi:hypothetical protein